ncbi:MAG: class I SAM-dependent methyltransferase [Bacteroidota bacterium]|jgi:16S rRNA G966 N2-methylase RsmD
MNNKKPIYKKIGFVLTHPKVYLNLFYYHIKVFIEKVKGIDFTKIEQAPALNLVGTPNNGYWSSNNKFLRNGLNSLNLDVQKSIIDIGCGKGEVLIAFNKYGFKNVAGIELTVKLYNIAKSNISKLKLDNIKIYNENAIEFDYYEKYNYFYLYNPFHSEVMRPVIDKIESTLITQPRNIIIIYKNPVCHDEIIKNKIFELKREFPTEIKGISFYIYANFNLS